MIILFFLVPAWLACTILAIVFGTRLSNEGGADDPDSKKRFGQMLGFSIAAALLFLVVVGVFFADDHVRGSDIANTRQKYLR